jgi:tRNA-intron lyase
MEDNLEVIKIKWNSKNKMGIINDYKIVEEIRKKYKIICEPIGTPAISRRQNKLLIGPYILNKYDSFYLYENKHILLDSEKIEDEKNFLIEYGNNKNSILFLIYKDLHEKDYYILPGSKYGVDFLVYKDDPNFVHSTYLITCKKNNENINVKDVINNERISVGTRKILIYAFVDDEKIKDNQSEVKINYINLSWTQI